MTDKELLKAICDYTGVVVGEWFEMNTIEMFRDDKRICKVDVDGFIVGKNQQFGNGEENILTMFKNLKKDIRILYGIPKAEPTVFMKALGVGYQDRFHLINFHDGSIIIFKSREKTFKFDTRGNLTKENGVQIPHVILHGFMNGDIIIDKDSITPF